jgi:hypothetical protein
MQRGWIGVDLDGCLATECGSDMSKIGEPVPLMIQRVKSWIEQGIEVKIVTARVAASGIRSEANGLLDDIQFAMRQRKMIESWCLNHIGQVLEVRSGKDFLMIYLWDDRCVRVVTNTGEVYNDKNL